MLLGSIAVAEKDGTQLSVAAAGCCYHWSRSIGQDQEALYIQENKP